MLNDKIIITVSGPDKSGKGYVIAAIAHTLGHLGCDVVVQCADTHNGKKLQKTDAEMATRLAGASIVLMEQQTN